jgi:hypothetical protein
MYLLFQVAAHKAPKVKDRITMDELFGAPASIAS